MAVNLLKLVLLVAAAVAISASNANDLDERWKIYKNNYGKQYSGNEDLYRRKIWEKAVQEIEAHNRLYEKGEKSFQLGETEFADMDEAEFEETMLLPSSFAMNNRPDRSKGFTPYSAVQKDSKVSIPKEMDWRRAGFVSRVKDQGTCGSCFAFAALGVLESHWRMYSGRTAELGEYSVQEVLDCSRGHGNLGCRGGWTSKTYQYIIDKGRISLAKSYPYEDRNFTCRAPTSPESFGASLSGYVETPENNEEEMKRAIALHGPVTSTIYSVKSFQLYNGTGDDLYDETNCPNNNTNNHEMMVVGYGTTKNGRDYWIVKNSWGEKWGDNGYVKVARGKHTCAFAWWGGIFPLIYDESPAPTNNNAPGAPINSLTTWITTTIIVAIISSFAK